MDWEHFFMCLLLGATVVATLLIAFIFITMLSPVGLMYCGLGFVVTLIISGGIYVATK